MYSESLTCRKLGLHVCLVAILLIVIAVPVHAQSSLARDSLLLQRGLIAMGEDNVDEAIDTFKRLLDSDSLHARGHYYLAQLYDKQGARTQAARHARLALRHDKDNIEHLILRHKIGFINIVPLTRLLKRDVLRRIQELEPENPYALTEIAREHSLRYLNHKDRMRVTDFITPSVSSTGTVQDPNAGDAGRGPISVPDQAPIRVRDPFDLQELENQGYTLVYDGHQADSSYGRALAHLKRALRTTPRYAEAYHVMMALYAMEGDHDNMGKWARTMRSFLPDDPYSSLYAGYASYKLDAMDDAEMYFKEGLEKMKEEDRAVFEDLTRVMNKAQQRQAEGESLKPDVYWATDDPYLLSGENERVLEHYTRLIFSELMFSEPKLDLKGWDSERGDVYVRYGPPESLFYMTHSVDNCGNAGLGNIINFQVFDYGDYQFVFGNLNSSFGVEGQSSLLGIPTLNEFVLYSPCANMYASRWVEGTTIDYVVRTKTHIRDMPEDFHLGGNTVDFPHLATQVRGKDGHAEVLVAYGLPVKSQGRRTTGLGTATVDMSAGAFLVNNDGVQARSKKDIGEVYKDELLFFDGAVLWPGTHTLNSPPGVYSLSVEFDRETDGAKGANRAETELRVYPEGEFASSDILLAYSIEENAGASLPDGYFYRNGVEIQAAPWGLYENQKPVYFYFELYNITPGANGLYEYDVEAALINHESLKKGIKRLFRFARRNKGDAVAVRFSRTSEGADAYEYLILETDTIEPGNYDLIVQVTDKSTGASVESKRTIFIR